MTGPAEVGGFALSLPPRITFGAGTAAQIPAIVAGHGDRVLVVTGANPDRLAGTLDPVRAAAADCAVVPVGSEPTVADARRAAEQAQRIGADVVLAVGGGSAIDLAKATAVLITNGGDPLDFIEVVGRGQPITVEPVPLVAVPTTSGTGAEVTANAVLAVPEHAVKASLRHPLMVPRHAVVDPELTLGCPPEVTAAAGMDALTQCLEPYVSNRANPVSDGWARTGLIAAAAGLRAAHADGADLAARSQMSLASLMGGLALANAKLGAVHGFAGVIGGMTSAAHGAICAALLPGVCRANLARADAALRARFDDIARWLTGSPSALAQDGVGWIEQTCGLLGIRGLGEFGLSESDIDEVVSGAARASSMAGNPVTLDREELAAILRGAL
jgi:alcohol dehydrogenase class IV